MSDAKCFGCRYQEVKYYEALGWISCCLDPDKGIIGEKRIMVSNVLFKKILSDEKQRERAIEATAPVWCRMRSGEIYK